MKDIIKELEDKIDQLIKSRESVNTAPLNDYISGHIDGSIYALNIAITAMKEKINNDYTGHESI